MFSRKAIFFTAALETALALAVGLGALLLPISLLWLFENSIAMDWLGAIRVGLDLWFSAHAVAIVVPAGTIAGVKVAEDFSVLLVPLGFTAYVIASAWRLGRRLAANTSLWPGWLGAALVYGATAVSLTALAKSEFGYPVEAQASFQPPLIFLVVTVAASLFANPVELGAEGFAAAPERVAVWRKLRTWYEGWGWMSRALFAPAVRAGTGVVALLLAAAAFGIGLTLAFNWIEVIKLYESMQLSLLGGLLLTLGLVALTPNLVLFGAAWLTGAGFVLGTGSSVSPFGTFLGPVPALPVFAAIPTSPTGQATGWLLALLVPLVAAVLATVWVRGYAANIRHEFATSFAAALSLGLSIGVVAAVELMLLALVTHSAVGPGRMQDVGVNPWLVGLASFVEVSIAATAAAFYSARPERPDLELVARVKR